MAVFRVDYWLPQETDIRQVSDDVNIIEKHIASMSGVNSVSTFIGGGALSFTLIYTPEDDNPSYGLLLVNTESYKDIPQLIDEVSTYLLSYSKPYLQ